METVKIKTVIEELLKQMNVVFDGVEHVDAPESKHIRFVIKSADSPLLIGAKGENLSAFNYIVRRLAAKALGDESTAKFFVDVNNYHEKNLEALKAKVNIMCERARSFKVDIELEPMSSYERMLIHSYLENASDIKTESKGDGASRRVVLKYVPA